MSLIISCHLLLLGATTFFFSWAFRCATKLLIWDLFNISFNYKKSFISVLIIFPPVGNFSVSMSLLVFCCLHCWYPALTWGGQIENRVLFQFLYICWFLFCVWVYCQFWRKFPEVLRRMHTLSCLVEMFVNTSLVYLPYDAIKLQHFSV